jgi:hypothetical protein
VVFFILIITAYFCAHYLLAAYALCLHHIHTSF